MVFVSKHWVWTLNNYTDDELAAIEQRQSSLGEDGDFQYIVFGREIGESGTPHLQGYCICTRRRSLSWIKSKIGQRIHAERMLGTSKQASEYCKKDGDYVEAGSGPSTKGGRTDLDSIYLAVKEGKTREEIGDQFMGTYLRYKRSIDALIAEHNDVPRGEGAIDVSVYWGATGTGKTRAVWDEFDHESIYCHGGDRWFDGYTGQPIVLFDDFDGGYFKLSYFLRLLDRYPMRVPIKGGFVQWKPQKIFITSNKPPEEWYSGAYTEHQLALRRRLTTIKEFVSSE